MGETRAAKLQAHIERLEQDVRDLDAQWRRLPKWLYGTAIALPVGLLGGVLLGLVAAGVWVSFVGTFAYIVGMRRAEHRGELTDARRELRRLAHAAEG